MSSKRGTAAATTSKGGASAPPSAPAPKPPVPSAKAEPAKADSAAAAGAGGAGGGSRSQIEQLFNQLQQADRGNMEEGFDAVGPKGLSQLCGELGIHDNDLDLYILAWRLGAAQSMCITRNEWLFAMYNYKVDHIGQLRSTLVPQWKQQCHEDEAAFRDMYHHAYDFIRADDEKLLPLEKAVRAWTSLLPETRFQWLSPWAQWLTVEYKRPISRDLWRQLLEFSLKIKTLEEYSASDKWPTALDDFVEWMLERQKAKAAAAATPAEKGGKGVQP
jgi:hypothetical protein